MQLRTAYLASLLLLMSSLLLPLAPTTPANAHQNHAKNSTFPVVDPNYIYDQLFYMVTHFQHREAGYDKNLPAQVNGHDEFAAYWTQEMLRNLQGFGAQATRDSFPIAGWANRPATVPAFNMEITIPGIVHPEQVVVIGCHYDGMAFSTQSANDDASGCAIELGIARAMADYWRSMNVYPARTLRFVIFDAEEQGLFGSFHYLNSTINGDRNNIIAMFNEEQNGIAYPLRYLGKLSNPLMPYYIDLTPLQSNDQYQFSLSPQQQQHIRRFRDLMQQAVVAVFQQFQAIGDQMLSYHTDNQQDVFQPIFTPDQLSYVHQEDDTLGSSDQVPFTLAGLPCATLVGNSSYYDQNPPPGSYPFDQPEDTIQLMNTFADGSSQRSNALVLSLAIPGMLTTWMLNQTDVLGYATNDSQPISAISDIGQAKVGQNLTFSAVQANEPAHSNASYTYSWNFGDGNIASGITVQHTYTRSGTYTLTLQVSDTVGGKRSISKVISVGTTITTYDNLYANPPSNGRPPGNSAVALPTPNDHLKDQVTTAQKAGTVTVVTVVTKNSGSPAAINTSNDTTMIWIIGGAILLVLFVGAALLGILHKRPQV
jgi:hypothetical protein